MLLGLTNLVTCIKQCNRYDFVQTTILGKGTYGEVYKVKYRTYDYAMKIARSGGVDELLWEMELYDQLDHPNIMKPICGATTKVDPFIIMPLYKGGNLLSRTYTEQEVVKIAAQLIAALYYIHLSGFIYFDLKPENILINSGLDVAISDMGLVQPKKNIEFYGGTVYTAAPELRKCMKSFFLCETKRISDSVDWYALGATLFTLVRGDYKLRDCYIHDIEDHIFPVHTSPEFNQLLSKLLALLPENRKFGNESMINSLINLPIFKGINWKDLIKIPSKLDPSKLSDLKLPESRKIKATAQAEEPAICKPKKNIGPIIPINPEIMPLKNNRNQLAINNRQIKNNQPFPQANPVARKRAVPAVRNKKVPKKEKTIIEEYYKEEIEKKQAKDKNEDMDVDQMELLDDDKEEEMNEAKRRKVDNAINYLQEFVLECEDPKAADEYRRIYLELLNARKRGY